MFALATHVHEQISLTGGLIGLDGQQLLRETFAGPAAEAESLGHQLAESILAQGGDEILSTIREQL